MVILILSKSLRVTPGSLLLGDDGGLVERCAVLLSNNISSFSCCSECTGPNNFYDETRSFGVFHLKISKIFPFALLSSTYVIF